MSVADDDFPRGGPLATCGEFGPWSAPAMLGYGLPKPPGCEKEAGHAGPHEITMKSARCLDEVAMWPCDPKELGYEPWGLYSRAQVRQILQLDDAEISAALVNSILPYP